MPVERKLVVRAWGLALVEELRCFTIVCTMPQFLDYVQVVGSFAYCVTQKAHLHVSKPNVVSRQFSAYLYLYMYHTQRVLHNYKEYNEKELK